MSQKQKQKQKNTIRINTLKKAFENGYSGPPTASNDELIYWLSKKRLSEVTIENQLIKKVQTEIQKRKFNVPKIIYELQKQLKELNEEKKSPKRISKKQLQEKLPKKQLDKKKLQKDDKQYRAKRIVNHRIKKGELQYLIAWEDSWANKGNEWKGLGKLKKRRKNGKALIKSIEESTKTKRHKGESLKDRLYDYVTTLINTSTLVNTSNYRSKLCEKATKNQVSDPLTTSNIYLRMWFAIHLKEDRGFVYQVAKSLGYEGYVGHTKADFIPFIKEVYRIPRHHKHLEKDTLNHILNEMCYEDTNFDDLYDQLIDVFTNVVT